VSDGLSESDICIRLNLGFQAIRVIQNELLPNIWNLTIDVISSGELAIDSIEVSGAFAKMKYWVEEIVNGSVIFSSDNKWAIGTFFHKDGKDASRNNLLLLPGTVNDITLAQVIYAKLTALSSGYVILGPLEITSEDSQGLSFFYTGETDSLPDIKQWIGNRYFFNQPWWQRNDSSTMDVAPSAKTDISILPNYASSLDFLIARPRKKRRQKAELIRPVFRPKIINGGL
jgi:hypothetical protein